MQHPVSMQVLTTVEELKHDAFHGSWWNGMPRWLGVMMYDLKEIVLGVFEDHEDTFIFEDDFDEADYIHVTQFGTEGHFPDG